MFNWFIFTPFVPEEIFFCEVRGVFPGNCKVGKKMQDFSTVYIDTPSLTLEMRCVFPSPVHCQISVGETFAMPHSCWDLGLDYYPAQATAALGYPSS